MPENIVKLPTKICPNCGRQDTYDVPESAASEYLNGAHVQNALHMLTAAQREQFITGFDDKCWNEIFRGMDEE